MLLLYIIIIRKRQYIAKHLFMYVQTHTHTHTYIHITVYITTMTSRAVWSQILFYAFILLGHCPKRHLESFISHSTLFSSHFKTIFNINLTLYFLWIPNRTQKKRTNANKRLKVRKMSRYTSNIIDISIA